MLMGPMCTVANGFTSWKSTEGASHVLSAAAMNNKTASRLLTLPNYHCFHETSGA